MYQFRVVYLLEDGHTLSTAACDCSRELVEHLINEPSYKRVWNEVKGGQFTEWTRTDRVIMDDNTKRLRREKIAELWKLEREAARLEAELAIRSSKYDAIDLNRKPEARRLERLMMKARRRLWRRRKNTENFTNGR
jgi:hypothetical protein